ncbi:MAG: hypothetical protein IJ788_07545 [Oscillospiraceae bacterium]|nr:hypothetical protein [Oscillospiraceae bacterium]
MKRTKLIYFIDLAVILCSVAAIIIFGRTYTFYEIGSHTYIAVLCAIAVIRLGMQVFFCFNGDTAWEKLMPTDVTGIFCILHYTAVNFLAPSMLDMSFKIAFSMYVGIALGWLVYLISRVRNRQIILAVFVLASQPLAAFLIMPSPLTWILCFAAFFAVMAPAQYFALKKYDTKLWRAFPVILSGVMLIVCGAICLVQYCAGSLTFVMSIPYIISLAVIVLGAGLGCAAGWGVWRFLLNENLS